MRAWLGALCRCTVVRNEARGAAICALRGHNTRRGGCAGDLGRCALLRWGPRWGGGGGGFCRALTRPRRDFRLGEVRAEGLLGESIMEMVVVCGDDKDPAASLETRLGGETLHRAESAAGTHIPKFVRERHT